MFEFIHNLWHRIYFYFYPDDMTEKQPLLFDPENGIINHNSQIINQDLEDWSDFEKEEIHVLTDEEIDALCSKYIGIKVETKFKNEPLRRNCYNSIAVTEENAVQ